MNWEGGGGGWAAVADWAQGGDGLSSCRLKGRWHLDAALVYGSVKLCGIAFNALCVQRILSGNLFAEAVGGDQLFGLSNLPFLALSRTLRFVRANLRQADLEYAILCAISAPAAAARGEPSLGAFSECAPRRRKHRLGAALVVARAALLLGLHAHAGRLGPLLGSHRAARPRRHVAQAVARHRGGRALAAAPVWRSADGRPPLLRPRAADVHVRVAPARM
uniref:Uncharacterized protein n=1 Tax=Emiliania huxleyi TaxID=2903 RepID=A0A7S3TNF5_EMIHU